MLSKESMILWWWDILNILNKNDISRPTTLVKLLKLSCYSGLIITALFGDKNCSGVSSFKKLDQGSVTDNMRNFRKSEHWN